MNTSSLKLQIVYLAHLRLYIRQGTRPKYPTLLHRHIDITTYWRDAYTKSEEDKVALHKDLAESRRINSEREEAKNETPLDTTAQRKRKRDETESIGHLTGSSKKARTTTLRRTMDSPFQALRAILDKPAADLIGKCRSSLLEKRSLTFSQCVFRSVPRATRYRS